MKSKSLKQQIDAINALFKAANLGVTIRQRGNRLYIRATLPPRPGSPRTDYYQQDFPTGFRAHPAGLKAAENLAKKVAGELAGKTFDWSNYGVAPMKARSEKSVAETTADMEEGYFQRRPRTPTTELTWDHGYWTFFKRLPQEARLSQEVMRQAILLTKPDSCARKRICFAYKKLGEFAGIEVGFIKELEGTYSSLRPAPRKLPSDEEIVQAIEQIPKKSWRWVAAMIATYGLRPHEVFRLDLSHWPQVEVLENTKTGRRMVRPLRPEWVDLFDLATPHLPVANCRTNSCFGERVSMAFNRYKVPFKAYDLRHAWAVRAICYKVPVNMAARWMGHSVEIHTKIYERWISAETEEAIYKKAIEARDRPTAPKATRISPTSSTPKPVKSKDPVPKQGTGRKRTHNKPDLANQLSLIPEEGTDPRQESA